jgi:tetratricopeptide (TPR) repeat protein
MRSFFCGAAVAVVAVIAVFNATGCADSAIAEANAAQLQQEQKQIDDLQHQLDALKQQQAKFYGMSSSIAPGGCDQGVTHDATQRGEAKLATHDFEAALGYFEDAQTACPNSPEAELNLARAYEAMGEQDQAVPHYQRAISLAGSSNPFITKQAEKALTHIAANPN